jgi:hypothetical protein
MKLLLQLSQKLGLFLSVAKIPASSMCAFEVYQLNRNLACYYNKTPQPVFMKYLSLIFFSVFLFNFSLKSQNQLSGNTFSRPAPTEEHYFVFVLANRPMEFQEIRGEITKYIWKHYPQSNLKITQIQVEGDLEDVPMILLQSFSNRHNGMEFYRNLQKNLPGFIQMGITTDYFAMSTSNYNRMLQMKSLSGYRAFFDKEYLQQASQR